MINGWINQKILASQMFDPMFVPFVLLVESFVGGGPFFKDFGPFSN